MDRSESMHKWHISTDVTSSAVNSHNTWKKILLSSEVVVLENNTQRVLGRLSFCIVTMILMNSCRVISDDNLGHPHCGFQSQVIDEISQTQLEHVEFIYVV